VDPTPPLAEGTQPGTSPQDFHSSSEARQGIAHLASTGPGERKVDIIIQHEEGVTAIPRDSNTVQGAPLPARIADRMPNINNNPAPPPPTGNPGTGTTGGNPGTGTTRGNPGTGTTGSNTGTGADAEEATGTGVRTSGGNPGGRSGSSGSSNTGSSRGMPGGWGALGSSILGGIGRMIPGVAELEASFLSLAYWAAGNSVTASFTGALMTAAEATPVVAGIGVVGAGTGALVRAGLEEAGVDHDVANGIGFGAAVATGAAIGTFIPIPGVGTAAGAVIGGVVAGALYLFSFW
jgi:hypothetical protein